MRQEQAIVINFLTDKCVLDLLLWQQTCFQAGPVKLQADKQTGKLMDIGFENDQSVGAFRFEEDAEKDSKLQALRIFLKAVEAKHASNDINLLEFACHKATPGVTKDHQ